jgi:hypothetical protein
VELDRLAVYRCSSQAIDELPRELRPVPHATTRNLRQQILKTIR